MDGTGELDEFDLIALRRSAAMAHTVAGLTIRLRAGNHRLATVTSAATGRALPDRHPTRLVLDACGFRMAVANAWEDARRGRRVALGAAFGPGTELPGGLDVDWSIAPPGRLLGFGAARTRCAGHFVWAAPSMLPPDDLAAVLSDVTGGDAEPVLGATDEVAARLVRDDLLGVSVLSIELDPAMTGDRTATLATALDEVVRRLVAASGAAELVATFAPVP